MRQSADMPGESFIDSWKGRPDAACSRTFDSTTKRCLGRQEGRFSHRYTLRPGCAVPCWSCRRSGLSARLCRRPAPPSFAMGEDPAACRLPNARDELNSRGSRTTTWSTSSAWPGTRGWSSGSDWNSPMPSSSGSKTIHNGLAPPSPGRWYSRTQRWPARSAIAASYAGWVSGMGRVARRRPRGEARPAPVRGVPPRHSDELVLPTARRGDGRVSNGQGEPRVVVTSLPADTLLRADRLRAL